MSDIEEFFPPAPIDVTNIDTALGFGWMPEDLSAAEWAAQRLREAQDALDAAALPISQYVEQVRRWATDRLKTGEASYLTKRVRFFEDALKRYALTERQRAGTNRQGEPIGATTKLPSATISTRAGTAAHYEWSVTDEGALLAWCEDNAPEAITRRVNLDALGELRVVEVMADANGAIEPGASAPPYDDVEMTFVVNDAGEKVPGIGHEWVEAKEPTAKVKVERD